MQDARAAHTAAYVTFIVASLSLLSVGSWLQQWDMHYGMVLSELVCVLLPAVVVAAFTRPSWPRIGSLSVKLPWVIWIAATAAVVAIAANLLAGLVVELVPSLKQNADLYREMVERLLRPDDPVRMAVGIASVSIAAPVCEEFLFRGVILPLQARGRDRYAVPIVINGLLFALMHVNPMGFVPLAIIGIFFAHLTVLTRSIWPAIIGHSALNTVSGVIVPMIALHEDSAMIEEPDLIAIAGGLAVVIPVASALWLFGARRIGAA